MFTVNPMFLLFSCFLCNFLFYSRGSEASLAAKKLKYIEMFKNMVEPEKLEKVFSELTEHPQEETTESGEYVANYIRDTWKSYGFKIEEPEYEVLLSFPQKDKPNKVSIINNDTKEVEYEIIGQLNVTAGSGSKKTYKYTPYIAFSPSGTVEGELVYADVGTHSNYLEFEKRNISLEGKIVILSELFADMDFLRQKGAAGFIIYYDPYFVALEGHTSNDTYPNTIWMPPHAVPSITQIVNSKLGDHLTPLLPSTCGMMRIPLNETSLEGLVPVQSISYKDASYLLSRMKGDEVPSSMKGKLDITYRLGPGFNTTKENTTLVARLEVNNKYVTKKIRNVIATIPGSEEPDRYVLFGNHRDTWSFGAADFSSGTAVLLEISRVLAMLMEKGWRPRRTIKLCSWDATKVGMLGSYEWSQENEKMIKERAVAYLNTDVAVGGNFVLLPQSSPMLADLVFKHAKQIQDPNNCSRSLFDTMLERLPKSEDYPGEPDIYNLHYDSDNYALTYLTGLTAADFNFFFGYKNQLKLYPLYHTQYDNLDWIKNFADPTFVVFTAMGQFLGGMLIDLSDSEILPFSVPRFGKSIHKAFKTLSDSSYTNELHPLQMFYLRKATEEFVNMTTKFESAKQNLKDQQLNPLILRIFNDQMSKLEKVFFNENAHSSIILDQSPESKMLFAKSYLPTDRKLIYKDSFPNIEKVFAKEKLKPGEKRRRHMFEMSILIQAMRDATKLIKPFL